MLGRVERAFAHDLVDYEAELRAELRHLDRHGSLTPAVVLDEFCGVADGVLSAFDRYVTHGLVLSVGVPADPGGSRNTEQTRLPGSPVVARDDGVDTKREFGIACL